MIAELREKLAADLAVTGATVHDGWPDRLTPPALLVTPPSSGSYVTAGPDFGSTYIVAADVVVLVGKASLSLALEALDTLLEGVLTNTADWALSGVDAPAVVTVHGGECLGTTVHLSKASIL